MSGRALGCLLGLAAGDVVGWPSTRHRALALPPWTRRLARELDAFAEEEGVTTLPVPFALNQPPGPLTPGPSDDAEWAVFTAQTVLSGMDVDKAWIALAEDSEGVRARISVRTALDNLAAGLRPPASGHDNPHHFDDAACVRAVVYGLLHPGSAEAAADSAARDARITNSGDGIHGARAIASAVAVADTGVDGMAEAALAELPDGTEIARNAGTALTEARSERSPFALVPVLSEFVDHVYSYGIAAAETVPAALALLVAARGEFTAAVSASACLPRLGDSLPALVGALAGAAGGASAVPDEWTGKCRWLVGCCLPQLSGVDVGEVATALAERVGERKGNTGA